jgi:hypothetical protein
VSLVEAFVVVGVTLAAAFSLAVLGWTVLLRSRRDLYIAPFHVAGDNTDPGLGVALANMLRARLERLQRELASARATLDEQPSRQSGPEASEDPTSIILPSSIAVPRGLLDPVNIEVSIGKVAVGGLLTWLQKWALESRTLRFTLYYEGGRAVVSGNIEALPGARINDLWIEVEGSPEVIVTKTAHALLQSQLAQDARGPLGALDLSEFEDLLSCLYELSNINRRASLGGSREEIAARSTSIVDRLVPLTTRFPEWVPLFRLAAGVAELAGRFDQALSLRDSVKLASEMRDSENLEETFQYAVRVFSRRLYPDDDPPEVAFISDGLAPAAWNSDLDRYEVDPNRLDQPRLHGYVALMGRFMLRHYKECFPEPRDSIVAPSDLWQDFRWSLVEYLLLTDPAWPGGFDEFLRSFRVGKALHELDRRADVDREGLRRLALQLIDSFSCDWTFDTLLEKVLEVNNELGEPVPKLALSASFVFPQESVERA